MIHARIAIRHLFIPTFLLLRIIASLGAEPIREWPFEITAQSRPGTYWWCPGSAFDQESIDWNLTRLHEAGFGTAHIIPIYGAKGYEPHYIEFLSPHWMQMLSHILDKADHLNMHVDMTTGTGWCFGGPDISPVHRDAVVEWKPNAKELSLRGGMRVKRAAPGGEGPMLNPFSPDAIDLYLNRFTNAFSEPARRRPRAQYHDSFEYRANWTSDFLNQFQQRRGYDLEPHLPVFFAPTTDSNRDIKRRLKYDYRLTLARLHREYIAHWAAWARQHGMLTRNQAHGSPGNLLDVYAAATIPETEMFGAPEFAIPGFRRNPRFCRSGDSNPLIMKMASSAAHVAHQPPDQLVSSESFTWLREHWHTTLGQMKLSADLFFLAGINHMFYHGTCYSPKDVPWPGWFFYASTKADWRNTLWHDIEYLNLYLTRCQSVLQAGRPDNDVLVYWPIHDLWMDPDGLQKNLSVHHANWMTDQPIGKLAARLQQAGYAFDFVSDRMLHDLKASHNMINAPGGSYKSIVIPECHYMPPETIHELIRLVRSGVSVIFEKSLPQDIPGRASLEQQRNRFTTLITKLHKNAHIAGDIIQKLAELRIPREPMADAGLSCIRRRINGQAWYFIANHSARPVDRWITFGRPFQTARALDPMTGETAALAVRPHQQKPQACLQLLPGESMLLNLRNDKSDLQKHIYLQPAGPPTTLTGTWHIEFLNGGPARPNTYTTDTLASWTDAPDPRADDFAGTARYTLTFQLPEEQADEWILDLGDVRESARIRLNGQKAGVLFALPMRLRVAPLLKPGKNTLTIDVTNLSANRIRALDISDAGWKIMRDINIVNVNYKAFTPAEWPLAPSGLLGPVRLLPMQALHPEK